MEMFDEIIKEISIITSNLIFLKEKNEGFNVYEKVWKRLPIVLEDIMRSEVIDEYDFIKILGNVSE